MKPFDARTCIRTEYIEDVGDWMWPADDVMLWYIITKEWPAFKDAYLKYREGDFCCVQAGGACGMYPRLLSKIFKHVYTFEPDYLNFHCLVNNCQEENIVKINAALGDEHKMIRINRSHPTNAGMHKVDLDISGYVPQLKIDNFQFEHLDMIALDVEEYEIYALIGGENNIRKHTPLIVAENGDGEIIEYLQQVNKNYRLIETIRMDSFYKVVK